MKYSICRFTPKSTFHLGTKEGWLEGTERAIHSDTLFSAFCHNYSILYGQTALEEFLDLYQTAPPLIISSVFPVCTGEYFLPVPKNQFPNDPDLRKKTFVNLTCFNKLIQGVPLKHTINDNEPFFHEKLITVYATPRVTISAFTNTVADTEGGFYQIGQVFYEKNIELYFLYKRSDALPIEQFKAVMYVMADEGIGGDRSVGKGAFSYPQFDDIDIDVPEQTDAHVLLSLYFPNTLPIPHIESAFYDLILRKGYMFSPFEHNKEKKPIRMFTESSVFPNDAFDGGMLVDVTPDDFTLHHVFRYGMPLTVPCKLQVEDENDE